MSGATQGLSKSAAETVVLHVGRQFRASEKAVIEAALGASFTLSPAIGALGMSGSSVIVAVNAIALRRLRLPQA